MAEFFKHYGVNVTVQYCENFRKSLNEANISYTDLPIIEPTVLTYFLEGKQRYAVVNPYGEGDEKVYLTSQIPLDMNWQNLIDDCDWQSNGDEPMTLHTRAYLLIKKAINLALDYKSKQEDFDFFAPSQDPSADEIRLGLSSIGTFLEDVLQMDHHDVDPDIWNKLAKLK